MCEPHGERYEEALDIIQDDGAEIARLKAEVEGLKLANRLLHDATIVLRNGMGGHEHWDHTMQHGAGCKICIAQKEARNECIRLIEAAAEAAQLSSEPSEPGA